MFKTSLVIALAVFAPAAMAATAGSSFVGQWKLDSSRSRLPDEMKVQNKSGNTYVFDFSGTLETIVVDGSDQPGVGGSLLAVKPEAPDTWIVTRKRGGLVVVRATWKLSSDGRTLTDYFRGFGPGGPMQSMDYVYQRTGGGSGFAADLQSIRETMNSPFQIQVKPFQADGVSFVNHTTQITKNMTFDGKDHPVEGANAPAGASASIRQVDPRNLVITDKFNGTVTITEDVGLSSDLNTLTITQHITGRDKPNVLVLKRT